MNKLSLVTITFNEEENIARCLESVREVVDEMLVVDSFSNDRTVEIAEQHGAVVIKHAFEGYREQKIYAIGQASYDRVLYLDADEALSPELLASVKQAKADWPADCYWVNRLSSMGGRWIRHGAWYPDRKMRLFDRRKYIATGINPHDQFLPARGAGVGQLRGDILHYTNTDLDDRYTSINRLSSVAASAYFERGKRGNWLRMVTKPTIRFLAEYIFKGGFLDGFYGYFIARSSAHYVFMREAKLLDLQRQKDQKR